MKIINIIFVLFLSSTLAFSFPTWIKVFDTKPYPLNLVSIDSNNLYLYMYTNRYNYIHKSTNGGLNWNFIDTLFDDLTGGILSFMDCPDKNNIYILCNTVWEDSKYTKNKKILLLDSNGKKKSLTKLNNPLDTLTHSLETFTMKDSLFGIVESYNGIYVTKDAWKSQKYIYIDDYYALASDISIFSEQDFSISTGYGYFYRTTDGGETFRKVKVGNQIQKIQQINDSVIYLGCSTQLSSAPTTGKTLIYKSIDSGNTWTLVKEIDEFKYDFYVYGFKMLDSENGMIISGNEILLQTKDGWNTYTKDTIKSFPLGVTLTPIIEYSGNRPLVALSGYGLWTYIDTLYENMQGPILINPENNSQGLISEQNLTWKKVSDNNKYILQLSFDSLFSTLIIDDTLTISLLDEKENVTNKVNSLQSCKRYYWRVASIKGETAKWSETWTFQTLIETPKLQYPKNNTEITIDTIEFRWQLAKNAERYLCQVSLDSLFESLIYSQDTLRINRLTLSDLPKEKQLYWRARTYCSESYGNWSNIFNFKIKDLSSIEDNGYSDKIIISPNPATDYITINLSSINPTLKRGVEGEVAVEIYDVMGMLVAQTPSSVINGQTGASDPPRIDVSNLSPGVYFVKIVGSNGACSIVEKFVKM